MTAATADQQPRPGLSPRLPRRQRARARTCAPAMTTSSTGRAGRSSTRRSTTPTRRAESCGVAASSRTSSTSARSTTRRPARPNGPQRLAEMQAPLELSVDERRPERAARHDRRAEGRRSRRRAGLLLHGGRRPLAGELLSSTTTPTRRSRTRRRSATSPPGSGYSITESVRERLGPDRGDLRRRQPAVERSTWLAGETVTCTFTNSVTYPRPGGGSPLRVPLVPAFTRARLPTRVTSAACISLVHRADARVLTAQDLHGRCGPGLREADSDPRRYGHLPGRGGHPAQHSKPPTSARPPTAPTTRAR